MTFDLILDKLNWTHGDFSEYVRQLVLYGAGITLASFRPAGFTSWRYFGTLALMTANEGVARVALGYDVTTAWIVCTASQAVFAAILFIIAQTWVGMAVGALFGVSIAGAGLTAWGLLSPLPSIGLSDNYWTVMSLASYAQDALILVYALSFAGRRVWKHS
jgi:hypothetical protein